MRISTITLEEDIVKNIQDEIDKSVISSIRNFMNGIIYINNKQFQIKKNWNWKRDKKYPLIKVFYKLEKL